MLGLFSHFISKAKAYLIFRLLGTFGQRNTIVAREYR